MCRSLSRDDEVLVLVLFWAKTMFYCSLHRMYGKAASTIWEVVKREVSGGTKLSGQFPAKNISCHKPWLRRTN